MNKKENPKMNQNPEGCNYCSIYEKKGYKYCGVCGSDLSQQRNAPVTKNVKRRRSQRPAPKISRGNKKGNNQKMRQPAKSRYRATHQRKAPYQQQEQNKL